MILPPWCKQVMTMIKEFLDYLRFEKNRSALTVKNYQKDLMAFEEFFRLLEPQLSWESIDSNIIRDCSTMCRFVMNKCNDNLWLSLWIKTGVV